MNWLDVIIIIVAILLGFIGLKHGLIRSVCMIAGLVVGVVLAGRYHSFIGEAVWAQVVAFAIVLIVSLIVANLIGYLIKRLLRVAMLGWVDKLGGVILGVIIGLFICVALLALVAKVTTFDLNIPAVAGISADKVQEALNNSQDWIAEQISESYLAELLLGRFPVMLALLPGEFDFLPHFFR